MCYRNKLALPCLAYVHVCHKSLKRQSLMREGDDGAIHSDFIYTSELLMMIMKGKKQTQTE